nr:hypothetical protein [Acidimicrobiia bacterium]
RQLTVAEGEALAITTVYDAIHAGNPSPDLLAIKYLETLGRVANGQATKIFLPADFASGLGTLGAVAELFADSDGGDTGRAERSTTSRSDLRERLAESDRVRAAEADKPLDEPVMPPPPVAIPKAPPPPPPGPLDETVLPPIPPA